MKKMQQYIQEIKSFFRIAPHLKDKPFYAKAFWYYLVLLSKLSANEEKLARVIPVLVFCSYSAYRIYGILLFFKVLIVSVLILELSCRFLKGNQYIFDKLSLVYGPELKTKFGNPFDHHTLTTIIKYTLIDFTYVFLWLTGLGILGSSTGTLCLRNWSNHEQTLTTLTE